MHSTSRLSDTPPNVTIPSWRRGRCWRRHEPPKASASEDRSAARTGGPTPAGQGTSGSRGMSVVGDCVVAGAVVLGSALQASIGFGIGLLAAPIVALVYPRLVPGTRIMVATVLTLIVVIREREDIDLRGTGWALVGRVPGTIAGALLLAMLPHRALVILLSVVVLSGVVVTSFGWIPVARRRNVVLAGAA